MKMSLSKGNVSRTRPQKHQNKSAFKNNLHDTSKKTKILNSLEVSGVCARCRGIIEWKIKFKKYKPLSAPSKCVVCGQKTVKHAYHVICSQCAADKAVCAKCHQPRENANVLESEKIINDSKIQEHLKGLTERKRRTILRYIKKLESNEQHVALADLDKLIEDFDIINFADDLNNLSNNGDDEIENIE